MALRDDAINFLRQVFGRERAEREKAESPSAEAEKNIPSSIWSVWGREDVGGLLTVSQNLMDKFADWEQMDEYPDINCLAGDTKVYIAEGSVIKPVTIHELAAEGGGFNILAFDMEQGKIVTVLGENPRLTANDAPVIAVKLANGETIKCTKEHKFLKHGIGYVDASTLKKGDKIVSPWAGFTTTQISVFSYPAPYQVEVLEDPVDAGICKVYDITTKTHNFIANGVVVHNSANHYFTNDATQPDIDTGRTIWIHSKDQALKEMAETLLHKRLRIEDEIWSMVYTLVKMGNNYEEILVTENGVIGLNSLPVPTMRRVEQANGSLIGYVQDITGKFTQDAADLRGMLAGQTKIPDHVALFEEWQVLHSRLRGTARRCPYGFAVSDGARWIWKRLILLEDAMLIYKLTRAPARFAFYIDVTDIPSDKVESYLRKAKQDLRKQKMVNPRTQRLDMRFNPMDNSEDFFIAVREGRELARVEVLQGPDYQATDDVDYFARKLHGVLKVPRSYLGQDDAVPGKSILSNEDIRAARVTMGIQREVRNTIRRLVQIDLAARGIDPFKNDLQVLMTVPSGIYELAHMEVKNARADFAQRIQPFVSQRYILKNVFKMTDDEIEKLEEERKKDQAEQAALQAQQNPQGGSSGPLQMPDTTGALSSVGAPTPPGPIEIGPPPGTAGRPNNRGEWKAYDNARRIEEKRDEESEKRHDEIMNTLGKVLTEDRAFAHRMNHAQSAMNDIRHALFARNGNGHLMVAPRGRGHRS